MNWDRAAKAELAIFIVCVSLFFGYHTWLFFIRPRIPNRQQKYFNIYSSSHHSRGLWAEEVAQDERDALQTYGIQTLRNGITASSFLATACSLIAVQGILPILLDQSRITRLDLISADDPITKGPGLFSSTTKLAIAQMVVLFSFVSFAQNIRMLNHLGFYLRVVPSKRNRRNRFQQEEAIAMSLRAATTFTLGFRAFYAFIPLLMWIFGSTAFLCATVLEVVALWFTDTIKRKQPYGLEEDEDDNNDDGDITDGKEPKQAGKVLSQQPQRPAAGRDVEMGLSHRGSQRHGTSDIGVSDNKARSVQNNMISQD